MKRIFDIIGSILGLIILSPVLLIISIFILIKMGLPVFFLQTRPGLNAKPFEIIKFRTMTNERGPDNKLLSNARRISSLGMFLRHTSLDELPELINVLRGEMSLVGPRPLLMDYLPYFTPEQNRRHDVKPGITGWAQANGRNAIGWENKLRMDVWYVDNRTFWLDIKILFKTMITVFKKEGIAYEGDVAMPRFDEYVKKSRELS